MTEEGLGDILMILMWCFLCKNRVRDSLETCFGVTLNTRHVKGLFILVFLTRKHKKKKKKILTHSAQYEPGS